MFFKDVVGQDELKELLMRTARQGIVPHARLFCGEDGQVLATAQSEDSICHNLFKPVHTDNNAALYKWLVAFGVGGEHILCILVEMKIFHVGNG